MHRKYLVQLQIINMICQYVCWVFSLGTKKYGELETQSFQFVFPTFLLTDSLISSGLLFSCLYLKKSSLAYEIFKIPASFKIIISIIRKS